MDNDSMKLMWKMHLLHCKKYRNDCFKRFGLIIIPNDLQLIFAPNDLYELTTQCKHYEFLQKILSIKTENINSKQWILNYKQFMASIGISSNKIIIKPSPTRNPLTGGRMYAPAPSPTSASALPTTARPTKSPVRRPTRSQTDPTRSPTYKPTVSPTPSPTNQPTDPTISPSKTPLSEGKTHSLTRKPSNNPLRACYTHSPTTSPIIVTGIDMNNNNNSKGNMSAGTIAAIIIGILIFIICIISWIYFRIHTNKPLYPTKSDLVLPGYGIKNTSNNNNNTQMSRQLSNNDKIRRTQSIQAQDESDDNYCKSTTTC